MSHRCNQAQVVCGKLATLGKLPEIYNYLLYSHTGNTESFLMSMNVWKDDLFMH